MLKRLMVICLLVLPFCTVIAGDITMEGEFTWKKGKGKKDIEGTLKAVFTPDGDKKYKAVFNFDWKKKPKIYTGIVEGEIADGKLTGTILNETKKRTFAFVADVKSGKLTGKHWEIKKRKGKEQKVSTGIFTMSTK